jgi:hypothetical protein
VIDDIATQYRASAANAPDGAGRAGVQDPSARFAGAVLRRHIQIRDRTCVYPGCRCSARHADLDHTIDHGRGGATTEANSGPLCRHDHRLKHEGGWRLRQPEAGHFVWTSRLGHSYHRPPPAILQPLPDPLARDQLLVPLIIPVETNWENSQIWAQPPESEPQPPPKPDPSADIPPF